MRVFTGTTHQTGQSNDAHRAAGLSGQRGVIAGRPGPACGVGLAPILPCRANCDLGRQHTPRGRTTVDLSTFGLERATRCIKHGIDPSDTRPYRPTPDCSFTTTSRCQIRTARLRLHKILIQLYKNVHYS